MDYEKKYKEALERAEILKKTCGNPAIIGWCEHIFPELKESEDERIRKVLVRWFEVGARGSETFNGIPTDKILAWLEKQKPQQTPQWMIDFLDANRMKFASAIADDYDFVREEEGKIIAIINWLEKQSNNTALEAIKEKSVDNANKITPKFKVGDWIIRSAEGLKHDTYLITDVKDYYVCEDLSGEGATFTFNDVHKHFTLWTNHDAKKGDVLYSLDSCRPFIYKDRRPHEQASAYCGINVYGKFFLEDTKDCIIVIDKFVPATKEQRDLLFQRMHEANYEWDANKNELNKIKE